MTPELIEPQAVERVAKDAQQAAMLFVEQHRVQVIDVLTLERAVQTRAAIGVHQKAIIEQLSKPKAWAYGLHKWFCALEAAALAPFTELDTYLRVEIRKFKADQDRIREQQERELAELRRQEAEAQATREAAALEATGDHALAAAVVAEAIAAPAPVVVLPDVTRDVKFVRRWLFRIEFPQLVPREFLMIDEQKIAAYARSMKGSGKIPGVQFHYVDDPVR